MIIPFAIYAQALRETTTRNSRGAYIYKISLGLVNTPNIDKEIVLDKNDSGLIFENYEGQPGYMYKVSVGIKHTEFGYKVLNYNAKKNADGEKGDINFDTQTAFAAIYIDDTTDLKGLNMSLGVGTGIAKLTINRESDLKPYNIRNGALYTKEMQYFAGLHYGMYDMLSLSLIYTAQTMNTITGKDFSNDFVELNVDFKF